MKQDDLFENPKTWEDEWEGMPEYNNVNLPDAEIVATFKFRSKVDFDKFMVIVKEQLYDNERVFDGMQRKGNYSSWYPLNEKASKYRYVNES